MDPIEDRTPRGGLVQDALHELDSLLLREFQVKPLLDFHDRFVRLELRQDPRVISALLGSRSGGDEEQEKNLTRKSGMLASVMSATKLMMRLAFFLKLMNAVKHRFLNLAKCGDCIPPMASTISLESLTAGGKGFGSRPSM